jgi:hypothetical protein
MFLDKQPIKSWLISDRLEKVSSRARAFIRRSVPIHYAVSVTLTRSGWYPVLMLAGWHLFSQGIKNTKNPVAFQIDLQRSLSMNDIR